MSGEIYFSYSDRATVEEIKYHLETIANSLENNKPEYYEIGSGALINLKSVQTLTKSDPTPRLHFYIGGYNEGEMTFGKTFETIEARDAEYSRLKELMMKWNGK